MKILAIETSCDDTSISVVENFEILSLVTKSQVENHNKFGGVIPEYASRLHSETIFTLIKKAINQSKLNFSQIQAIAVTKGPGLVNALQVGVVVGKTLSQILKIPLYGINHLEAHVYSAFIEKKINVDFSNSLGLIVSGGHTILTKINKDYSFEVLGETLDDAIGEAFDKVGKMLNLPYPSGQIIDDIFKKYKGEYITFPKINMNNYDFSYSGLKTFVLNLIKKNKDFDKSQLISSFQKAAIDQLIEKVEKALLNFKINTILIGGGVSANSYLRESLEKLNNSNIKVIFPKLIYTQDNAAMIGFLASFKIQKNLIKIETLEMDANPNLFIGDN